MVDIIVFPGDVRKIKAEISKIDRQLEALANNLIFFSEQLNGKPAVYLYTSEQIAADPSLKAKQRVVIPEIVGAQEIDDSYERLLFTQIQPIIDAYELERRALDGKYADFTIHGPLGPGSGVFDENCVLVSGGNRIPPLFNPAVSVVEPVSPSQSPPDFLLFGGSQTDTNNELAHITKELSSITTLLTGACQVAPPIPSVPCQLARLDLEASLKARYDPILMTGLLLTEESALNSNPDLGSFTSNPLASVAAEKARIASFLSALSSIPVTNPVPPSLLTSNATAASARSTFITGTRIPEMDLFLNTNPGYYNTRFAVLRRRIADSGTVHQVLFYTDMINVKIPAEKADLEAQREDLAALLP